MSEAASYVDYKQFKNSPVIIFHPGSRNLYFGKASDPQPQSILHIIARKRNECSEALVHHDTIVPLSKKKISAKVPPEVESARLQLSYTLQSTLQSHENSKTLSSITTVASNNKNSKGYPVSSTKVPNSAEYGSLKVKPYIIGDEVLKISAEDGFNIHCPWRRGQLNLHRGVGGSISSVMTDLEDIWRWCLTEKLGIASKDVNSYKAVVVVPAMFDRVHAKQIMNLVINRLGFGSAFLVQDHVCATFGCGIACATVVDVGDQKISVSCVEDGISYPQSRVELKYGGGDLSLALYNLLNQTSFPVPIDISQMWDQEFLNNLKEKYCHLNVNLCGTKEETILWNKPGQIPTEYKVYFGDELLIVPLSYFNPDLLRGSIGRKAVISNIAQPSVSDDPFDKGYLTETSKRGLKDGEDADDYEQDDAKLQDGTSQTKKLTSFEQPLGIDQAILQSIDSCTVPDDLKRRLYSCIIVVGGGFKISGLPTWLNTKMRALTPSSFQSVDIEEVITPVKGGNPCTPAWKGAAILSSLETAKELWISETEWRRFGSKVLREKSLFHF